MSWRSIEKGGRPVHLDHVEHAGRVVAGSLEDYGEVGDRHVAIGSGDQRVVEALVDIDDQFHGDASLEGGGRDEGRPGREPGLSDITFSHHVCKVRDSSGQSPPTFAYELALGVEVGGKRLPLVEEVAVRGDRIHRTPLTL